MNYSSSQSGIEIVHVDGTRGTIDRPVPSMAGTFFVRYRDGILARHHARVLRLHGHPLDAVLSGFIKDLQSTSEWEAVRRDIDGYVRGRLDALARAEWDIKKERALSLLQRGDFTDADLLRGEIPESNWPQYEYQAERAQQLELAKERAHQAERIQREEKALKVRHLHEGNRELALSLLHDGQFAKADTLQREIPEDIWSWAEYMKERERWNTFFARRDQLIDRVTSLLHGRKLAEADACFRKCQDELCLPVDDYVSLKRLVATAHFATLGLVLDTEQERAILRPEKRLLIKARAGSGKTRMLCARAALSIFDEALDPSHVLVVAFNKSAAEEVNRRMRKDFDCPSFENARTFHSLAYQLAKSTRRKLLFDEGHHPSQQVQTGFVQSLLERILNPAFKALLYQFFRKEIEEVEHIGRDLSPENYNAFRRSLEQVSLKGEPVKSSGEKIIADFLFEHDISYTYEKIWGWGELERKQPYKPDFTIIANGCDFILEHWALDPRNKSAQLPEDWSITATEYRRQIVQKRTFWAQKDVKLIETHSGEVACGREKFELLLQERLEQSGIRCQRLPDEEIIRRVFATNFQISRMARQFLQFIQRAKKRCLSCDDVDELISYRKGNNQRLHLFYGLALRVYREYEKALADRDAMDFDDLLRLATEEVKQQGASATIHLGNDRFVRIGELKWVLVDEYQDFSELYYRLLSAILDANPDIRLMAVGDDWQAINGFAGAELRFFRDFDAYFPGSGDATVATNHRSARAVVDWGNRLMAGLGPEALACHDARNGDARIIDTDERWIEFRTDPQFAEKRRNDSVYFPGLPDCQAPSNGQKKLARVLKICVELYEQTASERMLLVSRMNKVYGLELGELRNHLIAVLTTVKGEDPQLLRKKIRVLTAHTSKGQEGEAVVVLDASERNFPKVHPDNFLYEIFDVTPAEVLAEEQRLFYVAITRPAETLWILTEADTTSLYVKKICKPAVIDRKPEQFAKGKLKTERQPSATFLRIKERLEALAPLTAPQPTV